MKIGMILKLINIKMEIKQILQNKVVGIVGSKNSGKTTALIHFIDYCQQFQAQKVAYFFHQEYKDTISGVDLFINDVEELLDVRNSFIFIDEFKTLFNLDDRHQRKTIEQIFAMLVHNNNVIVLCGLPDYYNHFMSKLINIWVLKTLKFSECVNGSDLKKYATRQSGDFNGGVGLNIPIEKVLVKGQYINIPYNKKSDKKVENIDLFAKIKRNKK
jgi:ABC-type cobalamin/Fe3+-siderophores transport system ATPase subunit